MPDADPFSATAAGAPWVPVEWLSEVAMALAYAAAGWTGLVALFAAATALTFALLAWHLQRRATPFPASILLVLAAACLSGSLLARPHLLALPALVLWVAGLISARERGRAPNPALLAVMAAWANLHGSFVLGLALVLPFALEALIESTDRRRAARGWSLFLLGAVLAALLTPYGVRGLLLPVRLLRQSQLAGIAEWQPTNFASPQGIELALVTVLVVAWARGLRLGVWRLALLLGLLHLALQHTRHQMLAGLIGALLLAEPFGEAFAPAPATAPANPRPRTWLAAAALCLLLLAALRAAEPVHRHDDPVSPISALSQVPAELAHRPVFNEYGFGGYLIFKGIRPFIDSRADLYGDDALRRYGAVLQMDSVEFSRFADANAIQWTILPAASPLLRTLDAMPDWRRLAADPVAVVHVRKQGQGSAPCSSRDPLGRKAPDP